MPHRCWCSLSTYSSDIDRVRHTGNYIALETCWRSTANRLSGQNVSRGLAGRLDVGRCVYRDSFRLCIHKREKKKNQTTTLLTCNQEKGGLWLFKLDVNRVKYKIDKNTHQMKMKAISNPEAIKDAGDLCAPGKEIINSYIISTFQLVYTIHVYCISPPDICV